MKKQFLVNYDDIISIDNLLFAWQEFIRGKKSKIDVLNFSLNLMDNILELHNDLANSIYKHGGYQDFYITDPKLRHIHKASVRDRLLHHAIYRKLYHFFANTFISDSCSCQIGKGTHKAINRFKTAICKASQNDTRTCWILKCDIKKFFASINHKILLKILAEYIPDKNINKLLKEIIESFKINSGKGLPLGNLTSQLFVNIYMNEFDQFVKHKIKAKYYIRYADDFVILSHNRKWMIDQLYLIKKFLSEQLNLTLHSQKTFLQTIASGADFLGWVNFPNHRVLRTKTKNRMMSRIKKFGTQESMASYAGLLKHGDTFKLRQELLNNYWFWQE